MRILLFYLLIQKVAKIQERASFCSQGAKFLDEKFLFSNISGSISHYWMLYCYLNFTSHLVKFGTSWKPREERLPVLPWVRYWSAPTHMKQGFWIKLTILISIRRQRKDKNSRKCPHGPGCLKCNSASSWALASTWRVQSRLAIFF